jgi:hypothetical protein
VRGKDAVTNFPHSEIFGEDGEKLSVEQVVEAVPAGTTVLP